MSDDGMLPMAGGRMGNVEFYRDTSGQWRWRVRAANHRIVAEGGEAYRRLVDAEHGYRVAFGLAREPEPLPDDG